MQLELARSILFAKSMAEMVGFYRDLLGLVEVTTADTSDEWRVFRAGPVELALHAIPAPFADGIEISDPPEPRSSAVTKLVFRVADVAETRALLQKKGVIEVHQSFLNAEGPLVRCDFLDPEGNVFQISSE